jgi:hypothetical protein
MTDPIQVLRAWTPPPEQGKLVSGEWTHTRDYSAALAQVEALVEAARAVQWSRGNPNDEAYEHQGTFTNGGDYVSKKRLDEIDVALAPFKENP